MLLLLVGFWPHHVDSGLGVNQWSLTRSIADLIGATPATVVAAAQTLANVVLFAPIGVLVAWWRPRMSSMWALALGFAVSAMIEIVQMVGPIDRTAAWSDVVANTAGAWLGFLVVRHAPRDPRLRTIFGAMVALVVGSVLAVLVWGLISTP